MPKKEVDLTALLECEKKFGIDVMGELPEWLAKIRELEPDPSPNVKVSNGGRKYRLASSVQKAFRRGLLPTLDIMLSGLHSLDSNYAWRRLAVILLEDAGVALQPFDLAKFLVLVRGKYMREHFGVTVDDLCRLGRHFGKFARDRNACDLAVEVEYSHVLKSQATYAAGAGPAGIKPHVDIYDTAYQVAFFAVTDSAFPIKTLEQLLGEAGLKDPHVWFCAVEATRQRIDVLGPTYALAYLRFIADGANYNWKDDEFPEMAWIGSYPCCAFDQYVSDSGAALRYFLKMDDVPYVQEIRKIKSDFKEQYTITKKLMFWVEGGLLCRRLQYPSALDTKKRMRHLQIKHFGLEWEQYRTLQKLLFEAIPKLNYARGKTLIP